MTQDVFVRDAWTSFRNLETLPQDAGVPPIYLPRLVAKELADNALDALDALGTAGSCQVGRIDGENGFWVEDQGAGIDGTDDEVAALFSISRPLSSSKLLRLPTRGALGNGLRVVTGAVLASGGRLRVETRGRAMNIITSDETGRSIACNVEPCDTEGTRIEVVLGPALRVHEDDLDWAREAIALSRGESRYKGRPSPHWYNGDAFFELCKASQGGRTVRELVTMLDGCADPKAGEIAAGFLGRRAQELSRAEAGRLLEAAKAAAKAVDVKRLGRVGPMAQLGSYYARRDGVIDLPVRRGCSAQLPYVVEVWGDLCEADEEEFRLSVNRTPAPVEFTAWHTNASFYYAGCGVEKELTIGRKRVKVWVNIDTPYMRITSHGKTPDLRPFAGVVNELILKVVQKAKREAGRSGGGRALTQKDIIIGNLEIAAEKASGFGVYRFSLRQLFYAVRPFVMEEFGKEPEYGYFCDVVTDYEEEHGEIHGMYRDPRGTLYHPHTRREIPLGTISIEGYERPAWTFNKILFCEKEGFFPILRDTGWPERNDCALVSSKGFASRAVKDLFDLLGETDEEITFYCIHDADASGTMIYQTLQGETKARPGRKVKVVNLGLEPEEAENMNLQIEAVNRESERTAAVADYVEPEWRKWLQTQRVELNAMTTPQFIEWLDGKFAGAVGKVIPPRDVLEDRLRGSVHEQAERTITEAVLREALIDERVERAVLSLEPEIVHVARTLDKTVESELKAKPSNLWKTPVDEAASEIVARVRPS